MGLFYGLFFSRRFWYVPQKLWRIETFEFDLEKLDKLPFEYLLTQSQVMPILLGVGTGNRIFGFVLSGPLADSVVVYT